jgi:anti-sigma factor RsiW
MNDRQQEKPDPIANEGLVAYLDGELSAEERQCIEQRLANDPDCQRQLNALQKSWDLLDVLPRATADHELMQTTIAMVARQVQEETAKSSPAGSKVSRSFPWKGVAIVTTALIGFAIVDIPMRMLRHRNLRDLPIAQNLELYHYADDIEFLDLLQREGMFAEEESNDL